MISDWFVPLAMSTSIISVQFDMIYEWTEEILVGGNIFMSQNQHVMITSLSKTSVGKCHTVIWHCSQVQIMPVPDFNKKKKKKKFW